MPVIHVRGTSIAAERATTRALASVSNAVAAAIGADVHRVWSTFATLDLSTVGEREQPGILYVDVLIKHRGDDVNRAALAAAGRAASKAFGVPQQDVWARLVVLGPNDVFPA